MNEFSVAVDPQSLALSKSGQITGRVHVNVAGYAFPEAEWNDLVVALLGAWLDALPHIGQAPVRLPFFDGPFDIEVREESDDHLVVRCVHRVSGAVESEAMVIRADVVHRLVSAANAVGAECERRGWKTSDLRQLRTRLSTWRV